MLNDSSNNNNSSNKNAAELNVTGNLLSKSYRKAVKHRTFKP